MIVILIDLEKIDFFWMMCFKSISMSTMKVIKLEGLDRELNPGPLTPEARIIPLDQQAIDQDYETMNHRYIWKLLTRCYVGRICLSSVLADLEIIHKFATQYVCNAGEWLEFTVNLVLEYNPECWQDLPTAMSAYIN